MRLLVIQSHPIQHFSPAWRALAKSGAHVRVLYLSLANALPTYDEAFARDYSFDGELLSGYEWASARTPGGHDAIRHPSRLSSLKALAKEVSDPRWDHVLVMGYSYLANWQAVALARWRGANILYFSDSTMRSRAREGGVWRIVKQLAVSRYLHAIDCVLSPGDSNRAYVRSFGVADQRIWRCPYPVDVGLWAERARIAKARRVILRAMWGVGDGDLVAAFLGKLIPRKRAEDVCRAVIKAGPGVHGVIIGSGPLEKELRGAFGDRVSFLGFTNQSQIPALFSACDVLVVPSSYDPHPLVVTEAAATGLPAFVSAEVGCIGPSDMLVPGETGEVFPVGGIEELVALLRRAAEDRGWVRRLGIEAGDRALTQSAEEFATRLSAAAQGIGRGHASALARGWCN